MDQALGLMQKVVGPYERFDGFSGESINERSVTDINSEKDFFFMILLLPPTITLDLWPAGQFICQNFNFLEKEMESFTYSFVCLFFCWWWAGVDPIIQLYL